MKLQRGKYFIPGIVHFSQTSARRNSSFSGFTKILVVGGYTTSVQTFPDVEIIDMASSEANCSKFESFPYNVSGAVSGLDFNNRPFICGGKYLKECYNYENGNWNQGISMNEGRHLAASLSIFQGLFFFF